jgi:uncharacterized protein
LSRPLLIIGASGRAAAMSARRAGYEPTVIDLFGDADTRAVAECHVCSWDDYPHGIAVLAEKLPPMSFRYTGGIENHPSVIAELSKRHTLIGNGPDVLKKVRDPAAWTHLLKGYGFSIPKLAIPGSKPPRGGEWVRKPFASSGGLGVRLAKPTDLFGITDPDCGYFLQEFIRGPVMSAYYRSAWPGCELRGTTEQLVGEPWLHAKDFLYCGSILPAVIRDETRERLVLIGKALTDWANLDGEWGLDFVLRDRTPVPIEINPRYTASAELYDHHDGPGEIGKAVYYAPRRIVFPKTGPWADSLSRVRARTLQPVPEYADIPDPGSVIEAGRPVLTLFADFTDRSYGGNTRTQLKQRAAELDRLFAAEAAR